jgi:hypothetical protein
MLAAPTWGEAGAGLGMGGRMTEITRFEMDMDGSMEPSEHGEWVRYEDAQRQWVGLTYEDMVGLQKELFDKKGEVVLPTTFAMAVEAKLKEKNNG